jgi:hypothetical protein
VQRAQGLAPEGIHECIADVPEGGAQAREEPLARLRNISSLGGYEAYPEWFFAKLETLSLKPAKASQ